MSAGSRARNISLSASHAVSPGVNRQPLTLFSMISGLAADIGCEGRQAAGHGLQQGVGHPFVKRRQDENVHGVQQFGYAAGIPAKQTLLKRPPPPSCDIDGAHLPLVPRAPEQNSKSMSTNTRRRLSSVLFRWRFSRVPELLNAMDVFVLPSLNEGMSNTLLEAMSCGLPALATDVGGNPRSSKTTSTAAYLHPETRHGLRTS